MLIRGGKPFPAMRAALLALLAVVPLLAGCLGDGEQTETPTSTSSTFAVTVGRPEERVAPRLTDTLHFLDGNRLSTVEPDAYEPTRIPIYSLPSATASGNERTTLWNFTWPADAGMVRGVVTLVVDVHGLVLNSPFSFDVDQGRTCFWLLDVAVYDPATDQLDPNNGGGCIDEPRIVPEGLRTLQMEFELPAASYTAGLLASISFGTQAYAQSPDARVDLLTGSITQDSTITFEGVGWPVGLEQVTLLTTT
jgi:hypothetical protein